MPGRRLLDAAAIIKASRAVALKHLTYRRHQLDVYSKTSTLAKAVKFQTDRVTLTLRAASTLTERFNGQSPGLSSQANAGDGPDKKPKIPSQGSVEGSPAQDQDKQGLEQDHFYERSEANTTAKPLQDNQLSVRQEQAKRKPLPDGSIPPADASLGKDAVGPGAGAQSSTSKQDSKQSQRAGEQLPEVTTILNTDKTPHGLTADQAKKIQRQAERQIPSQSAKPPPTSSSNPKASSSSGDDTQELDIGHGQDVFYSPSPNVGNVLSALPRVKVPKATESAQESDPNVPDEQINQDVFYSSTSRSEGTTLSSARAIPEEGGPSEEMYSKIFQSPRVARMMKGQPQQDELSQRPVLKATTAISNKGQKSAEGNDHVSFSKRNDLQESRENLQRPAKATRELSEQSSGEKDAREFAEEMAKDTETFTDILKDVDEKPTQASYEMRESRVPSSRFGRLWQYGGLATSMAFGAIGESVRRATGSNDSAAGSNDSAAGSLMLSAGNMERLVAKLSRMRGAALKLGQMMSFQDSKMLPGPINEVLQRVQDSADYMPSSQRNKVLSSNLGSDWRGLFSTFDEKPIAAASIGQVHSAVLKSNGVPVAIKVQYPGVANSIDSDLNNLSVLLKASRLLPKGLYLDKTIANARTELAWECDYIREAEAGKRFQQLLRDEEDTFAIPSIFDEASGPQVLTMEMMTGTGVTKVKNFTQDQKDWIGTQILRLCLREITEFKYMQTDPNWTNFLFNSETKKLELLDFGASRDYPDKFIVPYIHILLAASRNDRNAVRERSIQLGYLTGYESGTMLNAHIDSVLTLAEPFSDKSPEIYDFRDQTITDRVRGLIPVMVRERLAPPPEETYSLHRKLSGAFLLCARLGSRVKCREMFSNAMVKAGVA